MNDIVNNNDFLHIFHNKEKKDFDFIVRQILYTKNSLWIIQQYNYNEPSEKLINILNNNINEMLSTFKISDIIKYIVENLNIMHHRFKNINKIITETTFLKLFFQNIKEDILKKIVKTIIYKNKHYDEIINSLNNIYNIIRTSTVFDPLINEINKYTIKYISKTNILGSYKIYQNNNNIFKKLFNSNLDCINLIVNNIIDYINNNQSIYIDLEIILIGFHHYNQSLLKHIQTYLLNLNKTIKEYNVNDGELLKNIFFHFNYIHHLQYLKKDINYSLIIKTNMNNIIHNDEILKYLIFGLSKIIMIIINSEYNISINIIYNIVSYLKYINNIDVTLQYFYESLQIRVKYYLVNNINYNSILIIENKFIEYLELVNYSKLQVFNDIQNCLTSLKTSIEFKQIMNHIDESIFISKKLNVELHNINIPEIFIKNVNLIKKQYLKKYNFDNRKLELSYKDSIVKLSINNITITGSLLPMSILYYYGSTDCTVSLRDSRDNPLSDSTGKGYEGLYNPLFRFSFGNCTNIDIFDIMFNNQNEELMNSSLNILKNNNLIINNKIIIPTKNIILNENLIDYNKIIEKVNYDRNIITKCYIMKTAKILKKNITKEELYNFTKKSLKYFDLDYELFDNMLNNCVEKELLNINSSGLLEYI
jgi:hypothetical protein